MASKSKKPHAIDISLFDELRTIGRAFALNTYPSIVIEGGPGIGKTETLSEVLTKVLGAESLKWHRIRGVHTAYDLYQRCFEHRFNHIVFDDLDGIQSDPRTTAILKSVMDTSEHRVVEWGSKATTSNESELPSRFDFRGSACIIANDIGSSMDAAAVLNRTAFFRFAPSGMEVHREVARGGWYHDDECFEFIGNNLQLASQPSFRTYLTASRHRAAFPGNWKQLVLKSMYQGDECLLVLSEILRDPTLNSDEERIAQLSKRMPNGAVSRATYYRMKSKLNEMHRGIDPVAVAAIKLPTHGDQRKVNDLGAQSLCSSAKKPSIPVSPDKAQELLLRAALAEAVKREDFERAAEIKKTLAYLDYSTKE